MSMNTMIYDFFYSISWTLLFIWMGICFKQMFLDKEPYRKKTFKQAWRDDCKRTGPYILPSVLLAVGLNVPFIDPAFTFCDGWLMLAYTFVIYFLYLIYGTETRPHNLLEWMYFTALCLLFTPVPVVPAWWFWRKKIYIPIDYPMDP